MFALQVGPVDGVTVPPGDATVPACSTSTVLQVLAHWGELSPAQQRSVRAAMAPRRPSAFGAFLFSGEELSATARGRIEALVTSALLEGERALGVTAPRISEIEIFRGSLSQEAGSTVSGMALPALTSAERLRLRLDERGSRTGGELTTDPSALVDPDQCHLRLSDAIPPELLEDTIRHEVFHCFQFHAHPPGRRADVMAMPPWLLEGAATWWGLRPQRAATLAEKRHYFLRYVSSPRLTLFNRDYDAFPFFVHLDTLRSAPPLPPRILGVMTLGSEQALAALTAPTPELGNSWASRTRGQTTDPLWSLPAPYHSPAAEPWRRPFAPPAMTLELAVGEARLDEINVTALTAWLVDAEGLGRLRFGSGMASWDRPQPFGFCRAEGCRCPPGAVLRPGTIPTEAPTLELAFAAIAAPARTVVRPLTEEERCVPEDAVDPCLLGAPWHLDTAHFRAQLAPRFHPPSRLDSVRGGETLTFQRREATARLDDLCVEATAAGVGTRVVGSGSSTATVRTRAGRLLSTNVRDGTTLRTSVRVGAAWQPMRVPLPLPMHVWADSSLAYQCAPDALTLTTGDNTTLRFTR